MKSRAVGTQGIVQPAETARLRTVDERAGSLQVLVAESEAEIEAAYALRYKVFYEEMHANAVGDVAARKRDFDAFDPYCDHLLVLDNDLGGGAEAVVGTYRLLRRDGAARAGRFYSADEYDISKLVAYDGEILELGRSCVDARYRTRATMQIMWRGIAAYVMAYKIDIMFGCASLHGTDPRAMAAPLAYLHHNRLAPTEIRPVALPERYVDMNLLPPDRIDTRAALKDLPPMIKGYLRLGGFVGEGAVIDHEFNTVDVCVVVQTDLVTEKYFKHYTRNMSNGQES